MLIIIHPDGTRESLYSDDNPLIPRERIIHDERVSDVQFSLEDSLWHVCHPTTGDRLFQKGFERRADAIKAEIAYLENRGLRL